MKDPANNPSPSFFPIASDSPVSSDSSTSTKPCLTIQSAGIWSPILSKIKSLTTISSIKISS